MQIVNLLLSAILQAIVFSIIPFVWWLIAGRKECSFFAWIGFKIPTIKDKRKYAIAFAVTIILLIIPALFIFPIFIDKTIVATSQFSGQGATAFIPVLIYAFLQTGFSEELFFRGFLTKRLVYKFGFQIGNVVQGILFGLLHGIMFASSTGFFGVALVIFFTGIVGWLMGWINEKLSDGSIVSSWMLHGCANTIASMVVMFNII